MLFFQFAKPRKLSGLILGKASGNVLLRVANKWTVRNDRVVNLALDADRTRALLCLRDACVGEELDASQEVFIVGSGKTATLTVSSGCPMRPRGICEASMLYNRFRCS